MAVLLALLSMVCNSPGSAISGSCPRLSFQLRRDKGKKWGAGSWGCSHHFCLVSKYSEYSITTLTKDGPCAPCQHLVVITPNRSRRMTTGVTQYSVPYPCEQWQVVTKFGHQPATDKRCMNICNSWETCQSIFSTEALWVKSGIAEGTEEVAFIKVAMETGLLGLI